MRLSFLSLVALMAPALALAAPHPLPEPAPVAAKHSNCPEVFAIYLGRGNDAQNRTWWFRSFGEGNGMRLSAINDSVSMFRLYETDVQQSDNDSIVLNSWDDSRTYIMPVSEELKDEHWDGWGELLDPIVGKIINQETCELSLVYKENKYLQRYGFNVHLTPQPTGGQIQWPKAWAVAPPTAAAGQVKALSAVACEEAYYKEPCR